MYILQNRQESRSERRKRNSKKAIWVTLGITLFVGLFWQNEIKSVFRKTRKQDLQSNAGIIDSATSPTSQVILNANGANEEVLLAAADYLDLTKDTASIAVHRRLVELAPSKLERHLDLVLSALLNKDFATAGEALQQARFFDDSDRLALDLLEAAVVRRGRAIEDLFDQLRRHWDGTPQNQLRFNILRLQVAHASVTPLAISEIQRLSANPQLRSACLRALIQHSMRANDVQAARRRAQELSSGKDVVFEDLLLCANISLITRQSSLENLIHELSPLAQKSPQSAGQYSAWLIMLGRSTLAAKWLAELPGPYIDQPAIVRAKADLAAANKDWKQLESLLARGAWGSIVPEALRMAMSSRLLNERRSSEIRMEMWSQALKSAQGRLESLLVLLRLARSWQWEAQVAETLRTISERHPYETGAYWNLAQIEVQAGETAKLRDIFARWHQASPTNTSVEIEWSLLVLLSAPEQPNAEIRLALAKLNAEDPKDAPRAVSYAFSLWQQGRATEALSVLLKLKAYELRDTRRALYCALILIENGKTDIAERFLPSVTSTRLLPEEKRLLQQARLRIQELTKLFMDDSEEGEEVSALPGLRKTAPSQP